jgi:deoxyhypusine synthase
MVKEQEEKKTIWTPSKMINRFGKVIDNPESVYYWCYKNNIPVYCPVFFKINVGNNRWKHRYEL